MAVNVAAWIFSRSTKVFRLATTSSPVARTTANVRCPLASWSNLDCTRVSVQSCSPSEQKFADAELITCQKPPTRQINLQDRRKYLSMWEGRYGKANGRGEGHENEKTAAATSPPPNVGPH